MRRGFMSTRNPMIRSMGSRGNDAVASSDPATYSGIIFKSALLIWLMLVPGAIMYYLVTTQAATLTNAWVIVPVIAGPIVGLIAVIVAHRSPAKAKVAAPIYAIAQGFSLGVISGMYTIMFGDAIVPTAILATVGVFFAMLFLYRSDAVRITDGFRRFMFIVLLGLIFANLLFFIVSFFTTAFAFSGLYLVITVIGVIAASLFLMIDFDTISKMVEAQAPSAYEWTLSLSLLVTLVWLYIELLRLFAIIASRRN